MVSRILPLVTRLVVIVGCTLYAWGQNHDDRPPIPRRKSFVAPPKKETRSYDTRDATIEIRTEGHMVGGAAQEKAVVNVAVHASGRLDSLLEHTSTAQCRAMVTAAFEQYMVNVIQEQPLPMEKHVFQSQCVNTTTPPPPSRQTFFVTSGATSEGDIRLLYLLLVHRDPRQVKRLIDALTEEGHSFVIHLDAKAPMSTFEELNGLLNDIPNAFLLDRRRSVEVQWGGFSVCAATLAALAYAMELGIEFDWFFNLSGTSYPIASDTVIREKLARHNRATIFSEASILKPSVSSWHRYIECDGRVHRIGRNFVPSDFDLFVGSQWFGAPHAVARWLLEDDLLVGPFLSYAKHIVVADEIVFNTLFRHSPFCHSVYHQNFHHINFGDAANSTSVNTSESFPSDRVRCLMPDPNHCGRSPGIIDVDYVPHLERSGALFTRKFAWCADETDPSCMAVLDAVDILRSRDSYENTKHKSSLRIGPLLLAIGAGGELGAYCVVRGASSSQVELQLCDVKDERQHMLLKPCSGYDLKTNISGLHCPESVDSSKNITTFPALCPVMSIHTSTGSNNRGGKGSEISSQSRTPLCIDIAGESTAPGANLIWYTCTGKWNQLLSFGGTSGAVPPCRAAFTGSGQGTSLCVSASSTPGGGLHAALCDSAAKNQVVRFIYVDQEKDSIDAGVPMRAEKKNAKWGVSDVQARDNEL